ncbi:DUF364 domain-containing protein [Termitidicoccus mucosus]|uniref:Heavy-metal chelation domain-containing protein n=1 Tax=Termitidicoccus mucosus TaxID=1184151 RepID=A0A178INA5_9BACT|nr:hypothetical protein AW736_03465 [Opitutaceae bacterium TSB47]
MSDSSAARAAHSLPSSFWSIYDVLVSGLPEDARVDAFAAGINWFGVRADGGLGLAMSPRETPVRIGPAGRVAGSPLREIAALARSWDFGEAALGIAALNAHHNQPARARERAERAGCVFSETGASVFTQMLPRIAGRRVAVIGHFHGLEEVARACKLSILERRPQSGDLPDPACEAVLPESDYVFITGTTLINKTLPRLLELARDAFVCLAGPTTPLAPGLFAFGVDLLAGLVVENPDEVWPVVQEGGRHAFFEHGARMVQIERAAAR